LKTGWIPAALQSFAVSSGVPKLNSTKGWWVSVYQRTDDKGDRNQHQHHPIEIDFTVEKAKKNRKPAPKTIDLREFDRTHGSRWEEGFREWHQQKGPCYHTLDYYLKTVQSHDHTPPDKHQKPASEDRSQGDGRTKALRDNEAVEDVSDDLVNLSLSHENDNTNHSINTSSSSSSSSSHLVRAVYFRDFEKALLHYVQKAVYIVGWCPWITAPKLLQALSLKKGVCILLWNDPNRPDEVRRVSDYARKNWKPWSEYDGSYCRLSCFLHMSEIKSIQQNTTYRIISNHITYINSNLI